MTGVLIQRENLYRDRPTENKDRHMWRMSCENKGRGQGDASTSQGHRGLPANHLRLGKRQGTDSPSQP